ncbi:MAG: NADH-quinone oxidoreductase subunit L, partial [Paraglaciecola sp.]
MQNTQDMQNLLFLVPLFPLVSSLILLLLHGRLAPFMVALFGVGSMALAAILTLVIGLEFFGQGAIAFQQVLFNWLPIAGASLDFALHLDQLSMVMMSVITGVGWMIHWYAAAYMYDDKDVQRFFVYMNLFIF